MEIFEGPRNNPLAILVCVFSILIRCCCLVPAPTPTLIAYHLALLAFPTVFHSYGKGMGIMSKLLCGNHMWVEISVGEGY